MKLRKSQILTSPLLESSVAQHPPTVLEGKSAVKNQASRSKICERSRLEESVKFGYSGKHLQFESPG